MTPVQIAYLKHFLYDSGIARQFIIAYRKRHLKNNPDSIEQWLQQAPIDKVLTKAFAFQLNHAYGCDYWNRVSDTWLEYWKMHESNFSNINYVFLKGSFNILRQNWDTFEYYKKESMSATYRRMGIDPPDGFIPDDEKPVTKEDLPLSPDTTESEATSPSVQSVDVSHQPPADLLADFEFIDIEKPVRWRLAPNEISINLNGSFKLTFNIEATKTISDGGFRFVRLGRPKSGDGVCIIFNRQAGAHVANLTSKKCNNATVNSKDICTRLRSFFSIKPDYQILNIRCLGSSADYLIYQITKPV